MWKKIITYTVAALAVIGVGVVLFSLIGVAVFFLPLLAGAFKKQNSICKARGYNIFCDPYYEGDGDELEATENQKCLYSSKFTVPGGEVSIFIINRSVMFNFEDAINKKLAGEDEEYEEADDFDEDYDAYDDI